MSGRNGKLYTNFFLICMNAFIPLPEVPRGLKKFFKELNGFCSTTKCKRL